MLLQNFPYQDEAERLEYEERVVEPMYRKLMAETTSVEQAYKYYSEGLMSEDEYEQLLSAIEEVEASRWYDDYDNFKDNEEMFI